MELFARDLEFVECPRWHDGALWLSDMWAHTVYRFDNAGGRTAVHRFPDDEDPGGIGWLPDGRMLVAGMEHSVVYRIEDGTAHPHADVSHLAPHGINDMIVATDGTAYVTQMGFPIGGTPTGQPTVLVRVSPDGEVSVAADQMLCPNGAAVTATGDTLVVAESAGRRLSRFSVKNGELVDRTHVPLTPKSGDALVAPDGICLDERGDVWVADPWGRRVLRVGPGGVDQQIPFEDIPLACVLGGDDRRTLFVCMNTVTFKRDRRAEPTGSIVQLRVEVPGAGRP
ncbi:MULTISPECIES: SMP-30/gluconolactonase/LRE family protein [unclassified Pseudofrankia]|uniref:SMP-30/gluconolactonase/LRE family protein n=1 Tax=unclassified Pseudofrankia TaxID=2994372 RepID=UPI0008DA9A31|nr:MULTISPECIES: SMP-30/gluconolactonase/LRE family protein [unclassified Pseudofrankia]MDT3440754.1 SMP-30/gluconolactonase/LRE family protein [Pseudofrankia sp. BMG5.37]OHV64719.1 hypothetical protein BCD48_37235 [Pseudofrankia sp. BMG5.36]